MSFRTLRYGMFGMILAGISPELAIPRALQDEVELEIYATTSLPAGTPHTQAYLSAIQNDLKYCFGTLSLTVAEGKPRAKGNAPYRLVAEHLNRGPLKPGDRLRWTKVAGGVNGEGPLLAYQYTWCIERPVQQGTVNYSLYKRDKDDYKKIGGWVVPVGDTRPFGMEEIGYSVATSGWIPKEVNTPPACPVSLEEAQQKVMATVMPGGIRETVFSQLVPITVTASTRGKGIRGGETLKADLVVVNRSPWPLKTLSISWMNQGSEIWYTGRGVVEIPPAVFASPLAPGGKTAFAVVFDRWSEPYRGRPSWAGFAPPSVQIGIKDAEFVFKGPGKSFRESQLARGVPLPPAANPAVPPDVKPPMIVNLPAAAAKIVGSGLKLESSKDGSYLSSWSKDSDYAEWTCELASGGRFLVEIACACGEGGGAYEVTIGEQKLKGTSEPTGGWQQFLQNVLGTVVLPAGKTVVTVKPTGAPSGSLMNLRGLRLIAEDSAAPAGESLPEGTIVLKVGDARIVGTKVHRVADDRDGHLEGWVSADEYVEWTWEAKSGGRFHVEILYSCGEGAGAEFTLQIGEQKISGKSQSTERWDEFRTFLVGKATIPAATCTVSLRFSSASPGPTGYMNLRSIRLIPVP